MHAQTRTERRARGRLWEIDHLWTPRYPAPTLAVQMLTSLEEELRTTPVPPHVRLTRERHVYGVAATELCRQMRVENKTRWPS